MAVTVRNKAIEARIREIGARTGEGPSALLDRLTRLEQARIAAEREAIAAERMRRLKATLDRFEPWSDEDRAAVWRDMDDMFDEDGLPK